MGYSYGVETREEISKIADDFRSLGFKITWEE